MTYADLASMLADLCRTIEGRGDKLGGASLDSAATALERAARKFRQELDSWLAGEAPGIAEFEQEINAPSVDLELLRCLHMRLVGTAVPRAKRPTIVKQLSAFVRSRQMGTQALEALRKLSVPAPPPNLADESALLQELQRMGGLDDETLELELKLRWKDGQALRQLATATGTKLRAKESRKKLVEVVTAFARRLYQNVY